MEMMTFMKVTRRFLLGGAVAIAAGWGAPASAQETQLRVALSVPFLGFPIFVYAVDQARQEAAQLGNVEIIVLDGQGSAPKQVSDIENMIVQGVDAILLSPIDVNALTKVSQEAINEGIPVLNVDRRVENVNGLLAFVGADNVAGGEAQARWIMERYPNGARIVNLQGQPGSSPAIDRNRGLHNILDPVADTYPIVAEQTANFLRADGLTVTQAILQSLGTPPDVIVAANDDSALGALEALNGAGLADKVTVIGYDALPPALSSIRSGDLDATIEMEFGEQFRHALRVAVASIRDGKAAEDRVFAPFAIDSKNLNNADRLAEIE
jgi:inositol transport system substrate-binding protein